MIRDTPRQGNRG